MIFSFLIGFGVSGRFVKKIKNRILRIFVRIILSLIFAILVVLFWLLSGKISQ
jgi:surface polysaccharide O-acyltransferase-like enzyme